MSETDWTIDWLIDLNGGLHPSFKKKMGQQLWNKSERILGIKHFEKYDFQLFFNDEDLRIRKSRNQITAEIKFITPTSYSFPVDVIWNLEGIEETEEIYKNDISDIEIEFEWSQDFPLDEIKKHIKPYRKDKPTKTGYNFEVHYYYYSFPDIQLNVVLSKQNFSKNVLMIKLEEFRITHLNEAEIQNFGVELIDMELSIVIDFGLKYNKRILKKLISFIDKEFPNDIELLEVR